MQIESLSTSLELFKLDTGRYPDDREGLTALVERPGDMPNWNGPYLKKDKVPLDPWGQPYHYRYPGQRGPFDIFSLGADNREGGRVRIRMSRAGNSCSKLGAGSPGFTLFEVLVGHGRHRDVDRCDLDALPFPIGGHSSQDRRHFSQLRGSAICARRDDPAENASRPIDVGERMIRFSDGRAPIAAREAINVAVTGADSENRSPSDGRHSFLSERQLNGRHHRFEVGKASL